MKGREGNKSCFLGFIFGFCLAGLSGTDACPKLCACYVPTEVHCTFRYLTTIPPQISQNVERINLGYNNLVKLTETDFSGLKKLELLMLHSNQIHTIQERTFLNLHLLQVLKMSYNKVKVVQADTFHGLTSLVRLHMDHNEIEFINPEAFYGLTSLKLLHLEGNLLKQLHPDTFVTLRFFQIFRTSSIKHIYLSDNFLTSLPRDIFTYMSELESLYLHGNSWICDCAMKWFAEWAEQRRDVIKCKKDRVPLGVLQCPLCANPRNSKGKQLADIPALHFNCVKPNIPPFLKFKNITMSDDGDFTSVTPKDFIAPIGSMILNMTDQMGNQGNLACNVQQPAKMSPLTHTKNTTSEELEISLSTFLVCSTDYGHIQKLWSILALYSDSPLQLKRVHLLAREPHVSYKYKQIDSKDEEVFTNIDAELRAEPPWLMQGEVSLQLDRTATTLNTLHILYSVDVQITLPITTAPKLERQNWVMILRNNHTRTEYSVLVGGSVELDCEALGNPTPAIEWLLADGSKIRAPYVSEDGRITISKTGKFTLRTADNFDTGVYHCIGTNYYDADVLTFRIIVTDPYIEHTHLNGPQLSAVLGDTLHLPCQSTGVPDASVNWILPDQVVLHHSLRNRLLFQNGTLKIQQVTNRDNGYFRCVAANQYGVDSLTYQVLVQKTNVSENLNVQLEDEKEEGSGSKDIEVIVRPLNPPTVVQALLTSHSSAVASTKHQAQKKIKNVSREAYRHNRAKKNRQFRGQRRQFGPSTKRINPLYWAAFLEKTKNSSLPRKPKNTTVKPTVKVIISSKISGKEEMSGDDILPEEGFILLATKRPARYTLREASGNVVTAKFGSMSSNYSFPSMIGMVIDTTAPASIPMNIHSQTPNNQKLYVEHNPEMGRPVLDIYQSSPTTSEPSTPPSDSVGHAPEILNTFQIVTPSEKNNLRFKITPTITQTEDAIITTSGVIPRVEKSHFFAEAFENSSKKLNHQISSVTVSLPDGIFRQNTEKITPQPQVDSTTITRQKVKIVQDSTTHTPHKRQYGRRRKISGRRRIVRPDRIPTAGHRFAFGRSGSPRASTSMPPHPYSVPIFTMPPGPYSMPIFTSSNKPLKQITSQAPTFTSSPKHQLEATTVNQRTAFVGNKQVAEEEDTTATAMPFYPESDTIAPFSIRVPKATIHSPTYAMKTTSTKTNTTPSVIKSVSPTVGTVTSSSASVGEIPSHNFSTSNQIQEKQHTSTEPSPVISSFLPLHSTVPIPTDKNSLEHVTAISKSENQSDALMAQMKFSDDLIRAKYVSTLSHGIIELSTSVSLSSPTVSLNKKDDGTNLKLILTPTTTAVERKASRRRVFRPGRRRGHRRRRPLKRLPHKTIIVNKGTANISKVIASSTLTTVIVSESVDPLPSELLSKSHTVTAKLEQPFISMTKNIKGNSENTIQSSIRNTTNENVFTIKLSVDDLEKSVTVIPLTEPSLQPLTTALPATSFVSLAPSSAKPSQSSAETGKESYLYVGGTAVQEQHTTAAPPTNTEPSVQTSTDGTYLTTTQEPNPLKSQTVIIPHGSVAPITMSSKWDQKPWHEPSPKTAESNRTLTINTLTVLKSSQSSTQFTPIRRETENNYVRSWSERIAGQETTTTKLVTLNYFYQTRIARPRIIGGKLAAFTVLANSDALIPCEVNGNPQPMIHWTKVSSGVDVLKHKLDHRYEVLPNGTLFIQNVRIQDRGQYRCIATNQHGSDRLLITLSVVAYPPRILGGRSKIITVHSGKPLSMKCVAEGQPTPTISWVLANKTYITESTMENGAFSVQRDGTLLITKVSIYDRGIYMCTANNPAGSDTMTVRVQVIAAPPVIIEDKRQHITEQIGESLKLPCTAKGNPHPNVYWVLFDGTAVKPLQYINGKLFLFPNGTLYIQNITPSDSGSYECIATSSTGSERRVVILQVEHSDTAPRISVASQRLTQLNFGDRLLLNCSALGEPKPRILWRLPSKAVVDQWHRMGSRIHVHTNGSLVIEAVTEKDAGDYICVARNKMGDDLILMKVSVTMKPAKIDQKQYFKKLVPFGKDFKVDCKASGSPEPEITWSLPDGTMVNNVMQADDSGHQTRQYILFENGTLYFNKVGIAEEGDYTCYAQNTLGKDEMKVHITVVATAPRIKQNSKAYTKIKAGDTARFDCEAIGEPKPKIFWLLPSNDMISASSDRYILHFNGSLTVTKVRLLDAGEYICVARNSGGDDTKLHKLEVASKPPLINGLYANKTVIKVKAIKHSKQQIDCKAEGTPPPQIMWIMPDNIFLTAPYYGSRITVHKNGTLEIRNVRSSDMAEFICVARNDGGESILVVQLEVLEMLRRPMFRNPFNEKITAKPGKTILLNCSVDGNPTPEIVWLLPNGTRLSSGVKTPQHYLGSNGTLVVHSPSIADMGKYRCAAKNKVGYIEKLIVLEIGRKPTIFIHPRGIIKSISGETLLLHCLAGGNPKPKIIWTLPGGYVLDRPQINGKHTLMENGTLVVRETAVHDRGSYVCKAQNDAGDTTVVVFVAVVAHPPRITKRPPRNIHTVAGVAVQLNCMALGIPKPEITWELPDHSLISRNNKGYPSESELLEPQGTLIIQNPKLSDSGTYKCMAKNQLGSDSTVTYIQVI